MSHAPVFFDLQPPPPKKDTEAPALVEYVSIPCESADRLHRPATDADRTLYAEAYAAFKAPAAKPEDGALARARAAVVKALTREKR